jgi:hypothetical protein
MGEEELERQAKATDKIIAKRVGIIVAVLLIIILIGWLNRYRYEHISNPEKIVRINRYTGQICYSQSDGTWNSNRLPEHVAPSGDLGLEPTSNYTSPNRCE